jgi:hypothetical protein
MKQIVGIENLKDEWRIAKLKNGDLRGLKNRFALAERLGINKLQTYYFAAGGLGDERVEIYAETDSGCHYSLKDLIDEVSSRGQVVIQLCSATWNKERTDATRKNIGDEFLYKTLYS